MAINDYTPEQKKAIEYFLPYVEQASRKVQDSPNGPFYFSAFVWRDDEENPILIHVGNTPYRGDDFIRLHYQLAWVSAMIDAQGRVERSDIKPAPMTQTPEEIADRLAVTLLGGIPEGVSDEVQELVQKYLQSRKR